MEGVKLRHFIQKNGPHNNGIGMRNIQVVKQGFQVSRSRCYTTWITKLLKNYHLFKVSFLKTIPLFLSNVIPHDENKICKHHM